MRPLILATYVSLTSALILPSRRTVHDPSQAFDRSSDSNNRKPAFYALHIRQETEPKYTMASFDPLGLSQPFDTSTSTPPPAPHHDHVDHHLKIPDLNLQKVQENKEIGIWVARGILLLCSAIWGTNFASVKYLENLCLEGTCHHFPSEAALARFGLAALVSSPFLFKQRWDVILGGLEIGMWITLGYVAQAVALQTIPAGKCAFICGLTVVFVPFVSALLQGKPVKSSNLVAAALALSGVGVLEGVVNVNDILGLHPDVSETGTVASAIASSSVVAAATGPLASIASHLGVEKGDLIALGQTVGFGYSFLRIEHYQTKFQDVPNRAMTIAAAQCMAVGILAFLWVLYDYHWTIPDMSYMMEPHHLAAVGWTGIVSTVFAIFLEGIALQRATATEASIITSTEPVWASLFGFLLLKEQIGMNSLLGGAVILIACLIGASSDVALVQEPDKLLMDEYRP